MNKYTFKLKILSIFILPLLSILYFAYISLSIHYKSLQHAYKIQDTSNLTKVLITLVYNLQLERGLGAGYITLKDTKGYKESLKEQFKNTDKIQETFKNIIYSEKYKNLYTNLNYQIKEKIRDVLSTLDSKDKIRKSIIDSSIDFYKEIDYYSNINKQIIYILKLLNYEDNEFYLDSIALNNLENIKEYAGLKRAYIYNQLLSGTNQKSINTLKELSIKEKMSKDRFLSFSSKRAKHVYINNIDKNLNKRLRDCELGLIDGSLDHNMAKQCFQTSTIYIDSLLYVSNKIMDNYILHSKHIEQKSKYTLYTNSTIWIISIIAILILIYILNTMLNAEESYTKKLMIASHAFNAQEAMVITDKHSNIIEINQAFTDITGYSTDDVIGKTPAILKSDQHDKDFFERMWYEITTVGKWQGEIINKKKSGELFTEKLSITAIKDDSNNITNFIAHFLDISDIIDARKKAEYQASHDYLTNSLNKKALLQRLNEEFKKAIRHNFKHAFLFIDLDDFKTVNDTYGHTVGDELIVQVASRLKESIREGDILARLSGDEFAIIILNLDEDKTKRLMDIESICHKILKAISTKFKLNNTMINISSSIGIKQFPSFENNVQDIIRHADMAMYQAKKEGKNQFVFFEHESKSSLGSPK